MASSLTLGDAPIALGTRTMRRLHVTTDLNGAPIDIVVHALTGRKPGPTLTLTCALHGGEWLPIEFLRRLVGELDPAEMTGSLVVLPVANPVAFGQLQRLVDQSEADTVDLNRCFPGRWDSIAERLARTIAQEVLTETDFLIDFHGGSFACAMGDVTYGTDYPDPGVIEGAKEMAKAFGYYAIQAGPVVTDFPGPRSLMGYAGTELGIPTIAAEVGAVGMGPALEEAYLATLRRGTLSVMRHLGILPGAPTYAERYLLFEKRHRVHPSQGGYLIPIFAPERQGEEVKEGEELGRVFSPHTFEELEVLRSPCDGIAFYVCRSYPVRPGDWAFGIADLTDARTRWQAPDAF